MISGHRRKMASELAGFENMPCIVRNLSDDEAVIVMVDSNLQREEILPSEKAFAYKMKLEAMSRQGKRLDITCAPEEHKLKGVKSRDILAEQSGESRETIRRYIRLTELIPEILEMVDEKKIAKRPAVELSYLPKEEQEILYDTMESEDCTPSHAQAIKKDVHLERLLLLYAVYSLLSCRVWESLTCRKRRGSRLLIVENEEDMETPAIALFCLLLAVMQVWESLTCRKKRCSRLLIVFSAGNQNPKIFRRRQIE